MSTLTLALKNYNRKYHHASRKTTIETGIPIQVSPYDDDIKIRDSLSLHLSADSHPKSLFSIPNIEGALWNTK